MSMDVFKCDFEIKFLDLGNIEITGSPIIDFDEYKTKKHSSLEEDRNDRIEYLEGKRIKKYRFALTKLFKYLIIKENFTYTDLEKLVDSTVEKSTISDWIYLYDNRKGVENGK